MGEVFPGGTHCGSPTGYLVPAEAWGLHPNPEGTESRLSFLSPFAFPDLGTAAAGRREPAFLFSIVFGQFLLRKAEEDEGDSRQRTLEGPSVMKTGLEALHLAPKELWMRPEMRI